MASRTTSKRGPKGIPAPKAAVEMPPGPEPEAESIVVDDRAAAKSQGMKLRDLVARVVDATGAKKKNARSIVEATLDELGAALARGDDLNLPGVGRIRVARSSDRDGRAIMTLKLRGAGKPRSKEPKEALAEHGEAV